MVKKMFHFCGGDSFVGFLDLENMGIETRIVALSKLELSYEYNIYFAQNGSSKTRIGLHGFIYLEKVG
jgi:hypothetical protein